LSTFHSRRTAFATSTRSAVFPFCTAVSFFNTSHIRSAQPVCEQRQRQHHCTHQSYATATHRHHCECSRSTMESQACRNAGAATRCTQTAPT
jgi:hypothetical protein